jgi:ElaB/YqjD/DUF883 family membrane-anchored ribosome-binding protein
MTVGILATWRVRPPSPVGGEGAVQDVYGQVKETASDAVEAIRESASGAEDFLRTTIVERPYTAAAVARGIGYLIGRFSRRENY